MKDKIISILLDLYKQYLKESIKERTKYLGKKEVEFKGDLDGFMNWLNKKVNYGKV